MPMPLSRAVAVFVRSTSSPRRLLLALLSIGVVAAAAAQPSEGDSKKAAIVRTDVAPVIDGRLDDAVWSQAAVIDDLHQVTPVEFSTPTERTVVYLLYDADTLYVGARMFDREPELINARILRQNQPIGSDDRFFVHLDPFGNRRSGYLFGVNPNGVRFDGIFQNITDRQFDWDGIYRAEATIDDEGWTAELAIPFKTLSFDPANDTWRMNFVSYIIRRNEQLAWVSRNRNTNPTTMGEVTGLRNLEQGLGLDVVPSVSVRERKDFATAARVSEKLPPANWKPYFWSRSAWTILTASQSASSSSAISIGSMVLMPWPISGFLPTMVIVLSGAIET
jgi:hypothetical protein